MERYIIYKALGRQVVFKGLAGAFIWWMGIALVTLLLLFAILYLLGVAVWFCLSVALGGGTACFIWVNRLSQKYGAHGWMKFRSKKYIPKHIKGFYFR
jgi:hypothetical protein